VLGRLFLLGGLVTVVGLIASEVGDLLSLATVVARPIT
jgi:hypothetical protein